MAAAAATLCLAAAGCTADLVDDPAESPSPSPSTSPSGSPGPVNLRFAVFGEKDEIAAYDAVATAYTELNPHVTITLEAAFTADAATEKLETDFEQGKAPDIFVTDHGALPQLVEDERVEPVSELLEEREVDFGDGYQRDALVAFSHDAELQCMPHDVSPLVVYYNEKLVDFETLTDPEEDQINAEDGWTFEEFTAAAQQATRQPDGQTAKGFYLEPSLESLAPFIWSSGGDLTDDPQTPTTLTLSDGDTREALELVLDVVRDPLLTPTQEELARQDAATRFERGRLGMILGTRDLTPRFRQAEGLDFEVMPLPRLGTFRTISAMSGYCISAESANIAAAADFLAFAAGEEGSTIMARSGYTVPTNLQVLNSPAFTNPAQQPVNSFIFSEAVRRTEPVPFVPAWSSVLQEIRPLMQRLFYAPVIDLDMLLEEIDMRSQTVLPPEEPEEDESPGAQ